MEQQTEQESQTKTSYQVIDSQTKQVIGTYSTLKRASHKADKLDLAYGSYRYIVESDYKGA